MIPHVTFNPSDGTIHLYETADSPSAIFEMDTEQTRELIAMLVGSIARIEHDPDRLELLFTELLARAKRGESWV
jgi:hypothetical protein